MDTNINTTVNANTDSYPLKNIEVGSCVYIVGRRQSGKTRLIADALIPALAPKHKHTIIYNSYSDITYNKKEDGTYVYGNDNDSDSDDDDYAYTEYDTLNSQIPTNVINTREFTEESCANIISKMDTRAKLKENDSLLLVIDVPVWWGYTLYKQANFIKLLKNCRYYNITIVMTTQFYDMPPSLRGFIDYTIIFNHISIRMAKYIPTKEDIDMYNLLSNLKNYHYVLISANELDKIYINKPESIYLDDKYVFTPLP
jgi:hypothetical protein